MSELETRHYLRNGAETLPDFDGVLRRIRLITGITSSETTLLLTTPRSTKARI